MTYLCADCDSPGADYYIPDPVFEDDGRWVCKACCLKLEAATEEGEKSSRIRLTFRPGLH